MNSQKNRSFYRSIQYCRGIAAFVVVIAHTLAHPLAVATNFLDMTGRLGVQIFFVVSGFIISTVCGSGAFNPGQFLFRRFMRVAPLYWLFTLMLAAVCIVAPQVLKTTTFSLDHMLLSLSFVPHQNPSDPTDYAPLLKLGWTLNYEMFFYAVMGALFFVTRARVRTLVLTIVFGTFMIARPLLVDFGPAFATYTDVTLLPFLIGVWIAEADRADAFRRTPAYAGTALLIMAGVACIALYQVPFESIQSFPNFLLLNLAAALLVVGLIQSEVQQHLPKLPILESIGDSSYSLYLSHIFIVGAAWNMAHRFLDADGFVSTYVTPTVIVMMCCVVGYALYLRIEKPLIRWSHDASKPKVPVYSRSESS